MLNKSKGLEFKNVIFIDKIKIEKFNQKEILFNFNNLELFDIKKNSKIRRNSDTLFNRYIQQSNNDDNSELTKLIYVAFTRAQHSLSIIFNKKNSKINHLFF